MEIWHNVNLTVFVIAATMMLIDVIVFSKRESPRIISIPGSISALFLTASFPLYIVASIWT